jgi:hypothetical protein
MRPSVDSANWSTPSVISSPMRAGLDRSLERMVWTSADGAWVCTKVAYRVSFYTASGRLSLLKEYRIYDVQ